MRAIAGARSWTRLFRHQSLSVRLLTAAAGLFTVATAVAAPADANPVDDAFLGALNKAGVNYGAPEGAVALGQEICPMLVKPGGNLAATYERVRGNGMSPEMARMFTTIAIQMYCPSIMSNLAQGNLSGLPQIPGLPGL